MDMLYYIYIGSNRVTIDHLSKIAGGMFMAVSSCNKAAKVIDVQHIHSLRRKHPSKGQPEHHFPAQALPPCLHHPHHRRPAEGTPQALSAGRCQQHPFPYGQRREPPANGKIPPVAQGAQTAGIQPVTP